MSTQKSPSIMNVHLNLHGDLPDDVQKFIDWCQSNPLVIPDADIQDEQYWGQKKNKDALLGWAYELWQAAKKDTEIQQ